MKKVTSLAITAIASLSIIAGATYAWFVASANSQTIDITTANIGVQIANLVGTDLSNKLPGETVRLTTSSVPIRNTGSRPAIVKVNFSSQTTGWLTRPIPADTADDIRADYFTDANNRVNFTPARLRFVFDLNMDVDSNQDWVRYGNSYYARIEDKSTLNLNNVYAKITSNLGGNVLQPNGTLSPNRSFEQGAAFSAGYAITAVQASEDAVKDVLGNDDLVFLKFARPTWFIFK